MTEKFNSCYSNSFFERISQLKYYSQFSRNLNLIIFLTTTFILISLSSKLKAQDPSFTQFYQNPIYYNPALAGLNDGLTIRTNYRNFWRKLDHGFNTTDLTIDSDEPFLSGGIGLIALNGIEGNGIILTQMVGMAYAYNLTIINRKLEIQMGLQGAWVQKSINTDNLIFSDQLDAIYGLTGTSAYSTDGLDKVNFPDFATGFNIRFNTGKFRGGIASTTLNTGFSMNHITQPNESFTGLESKLPIKYIGYTSAIIRLESFFSKKLYLMPGIIFEKQADFKTIQFGTNLKVSPIIIGIWFRNNGFISSPESIKAISINTGLELGEITTTKLRISYSYDINISRYKNLMGDSHEISLSLIIPDFQIFKPSHKNYNNRECYNKF